MNFRGILAIFLAITHFGRFIFVILSLWKFYTTEQNSFFYTYIIFFGLIYLLQIILLSNNVLNVILSIFSLQLTRIPFIVGKPKYRNRIAYFTCFEILNSAVSGYFSAYIAIQTSRLPLWIAIPHLVFSSLDISIYYSGILFSHTMAMPLIQYFVITFEFFLTVAFTSIVITLHHFWIAFCVGCWRLIILFEPFAFWCSLQTAISPFRAMERSKASRSLIAIFLLYMELFLLIYVVIWHMEKNVINQVFAYIYAVYFLIFIIKELLMKNIACTNRIKPITLATKEETKLFDPSVL